MLPEQFQKLSHLLSLNKYFVKHKWRIGLGVFFVVCANLLNVINPLITKGAVDLITENLSRVHHDQLHAQVIREQIGEDVFWLFSKYLVVALLAGGFTFMMRQSIIVVSRLIEFDLKNEVYEHYQKLDLAFYRKNNTGDLMNRITEDVSRVRMYVGPAIMYTTNLFFTITFAVASMFMLNSTLTLWVLIPLPILSFVIYYVNELVGKASTQIQEQLSEMTINAQETYSGIRVVQAYSREKEMLAHFAAEGETYKQKQLNLAKIDSVYFPSMTFLVGCSIIIVVWVGSQQISDGKLTIGALTAFLMYTNMLMWPVSSLGWTASMIQRAAVSQKRINEFLHLQPAIKESDRATDKPIQGKITFSSVSFTYPDTGIEALKDISFQMEKGERIAIIGKTGSGKTTIADLLMRMYDVSSGKIEIDDTDVKKWKLSSLRKQIGFVPQDVFLFSETITENIGFGKETITKEEAKLFAGYASIDKEIEAFPQGFSTVVGERGVTLSGGQKQRISIARALIKQPNVLLLDDSLSAVDTATEKQIQQSLDKVLKGKTTIIITHRIFSLFHFDNILVLDNGKIAEQGTHDKLIRAGGIYADIYRRQMNEQREETNA